MPVGKPAPPRPRKPEVTTSSTVAFGPDGNRLRQALVAAMRLVIFEAARIDDAAILEGQPRLALEPGIFLDHGRCRADASCLRACRRRAAPRRRPPARAHSRRGPAASPPRPAAPANTCRASRCARSRRRDRASRRPCGTRSPASSAPTQSAPESREMKMRALMLCASFTSASSLASSSMPNTCLSSIAAGEEWQSPRQ